MKARDRDLVARGPDPRSRVDVPKQGERCPRCHAPANGMRAHPCLLCRPDLVPVEFGGEKC